MSYATLALMLSIVGLWLMRGSRRDDRRMVTDAAAMQAEARYANLETSLQRGLEMEQTEEATYDVIAQALTIVAPDVPSEMLLADSSQAHFRQVFSTAPGADAACPRRCARRVPGNDERPDAVLQEQLAARHLPVPAREERRGVGQCACRSHRGPHHGRAPHATPGGSLRPQTPAAGGS